jgi:NADH-quinone oxidoreductase subunit E
VEERAKKEINSLIQQWKGKDVNIIMILHEIQSRHGYIPRELALEISKELAIPLARIYEVVTFYNLFKLTPPAKHNISVCMGTACYLNGATQILDEIKNLLHINEGEATPDGQFYLDIVRCLGCCGLAPVIMIDGKVYGKVKKSDIMDTLSKYVKEEENAQA